MSKFPPPPPPAIPPPPPPTLAPPPPPVGVPPLHYAHLPPAPMKPVGGRVLAGVAAGLLILASLYGLTVIIASLVGSPRATSAPLFRTSESPAMQRAFDALATARAYLASPVALTLGVMAAFVSILSRRPGMSHAIVGCALLAVLLLPDRIWNWTPPAFLAQIHSSLLIVGAAIAALAFFLIAEPGASPLRRVCCIAGAMVIHQCLREAQFTGGNRFPVLDVLHLLVLIAIVAAAACMLLRLPAAAMLLVIAGGTWILLALVTLAFAVLAEKDDYARAMMFSRSIHPPVSVLLCVVPLFGREIRRAINGTPST